MLLQFSACDVEVDIPPVINKMYEIMSSVWFTGDWYWQQMYVTSLFILLTMLIKPPNTVLLITRGFAISGDILVLILTWIKTYRQWRDSRSLHISFSVAGLLLRDGEMLFAAIHTGLLRQDFIKGLSISRMWWQYSPTQLILAFIVLFLPWTYIRC